MTFSPSATGPVNGTLAITADVAITGSPVTLTGTGLAVPTPTVLDTFNRGNANTLGTGWNQLVVSGSAGIRVNGNQANCTGTILCSNAVGSNAYRTTSFGANQAAAFTFANTTVNGNWLWLKAGGGQLLNTYLNGIRVAYDNGLVTVSTVTNGTATSVGTFSAGFASGDRLLAVADSSGTVTVWKISGTTTTFVGSASAGSGFTGGGFIGMHLSSGARVDDFAGGNL